MINLLENKIFKLIKLVITTALVTLLFACGGGGTTQSYQIIFDGTVSGLTSGQKVVLLASIPKTSQSVLISSSGGAFNSSITLPAPYTFSDAGVATVVVSSQPSTGNCTVSFASTTNILVLCAPTKTAAGYYSGTIVNETGDARLVILNDGSYWMLAGTTSGATSTYTHLISGAAGFSSAGAYKSIGGVEIGTAVPNLDISLSGDYSISGEFSGQFIEKTNSYPLKLTAPSASYYQFIKTPTLAAIVGSYRMSWAGDVADVSIPASGVFSGASSKGCILSGAITPKTTGENAYNLTMTYGAAPCTLPNYSGIGIVLIEINKAGTQIWGGSINASKSNGDIFIATKL